jgi:hypothetical protein
MPETKTKYLETEYLDLRPEPDFHPERDPLFRLERDVYCDVPPSGLSMEQLFAMHEYFHAVLAAGYRLYQIVPAAIAAPIIRKKFRKMIANPNVHE